MSEYFSKAAAFAQNAAKLSKKVSEGIVENAREFGLEATSSGHYFDTSEEKMRDIKRQLDSRHDREKMDGLKRLIAVCEKKVRFYQKRKIADFTVLSNSNAFVQK